MSSLQAGWKILAQKLDLAEQLRLHHVVEIDAATLKKVTGLEPRLLMKFDSRCQRPPCLTEASIFPVRNGLYKIVAGDGYHDLESPQKLVHYRGTRAARRLITLPWESIPSSESQALDMALASGMLGHFLDEKELVLTIRGRLRCPAFSFRFLTLEGGALELEVDGVQTEVDAGVEGMGIHLVEAKLGGRSDFHVRQLYYPLRMWSLRRGAKRVTAVFCSYSDRLFHLWQYAFEPLEDYHGIRLVQSASYSLDREEEAPDLQEALAGTRMTEALEDVPFPQADSLGRLIDVVEAVASGLGSPTDLVLRYGFTARQAAYYANAARFLGFLQGDFELSTAGTALARSTRIGRHTQIIWRLAELPVFRPALQFFQDRGRLPAPFELEELVRRATGLGGSTVARRAQTAMSWLRWVDQAIKPSPPEQQLFDF